MRRPHKVFLALLIVILAALLPVSMAVGQTPQFPNAFFGTVTINGSQPAPVGMVMLAVVDKGVAGSEKRYSLDIAEPGKYGGPEFLEPKLLVGGDQQGFIADGSPIQFFLVAGNNEFGPIAEVPFKDSSQVEVTNLDLSGNVPQPTLTVTKIVINDDGGTAAPGAFTITISGNSPDPSSFPGDPNGTVVTLDPGAYSVSEAGPGGYAESQSAGCSGTLIQGEYSNCTITNNDVTPTSSPPGGGGGNGGAVTSGGGGTGGAIVLTPAPSVAGITPTPVAGVPAVPVPTATPGAEPSPIQTPPSPTPTSEGVSGLGGAGAPTPAPSTPVAPAAISPTDTPEPGPPPPQDLPPSPPGGGPPQWVWLLIGLGVAAVIGGAAIYYLRFRSAAI